MSAAPTAAAQVPDAIAAKGETVVLTVHAEGAQVYESKADAGGKLTWQFREPVATLMADGKTVGRHYVGPTWEHADGSRVSGQADRPRQRRDREGHSLAQARSGGSRAAPARSRA